MVSSHVLLLDRAGNNLVNADFSLYLGHIFTVKHIYLTLYIVYMCRIAPIYSVPMYLLALLFTSSGPIGSSRSPSVLLAALVLAPVRSRARVRARARVCVGAVRLPSSRLPCILFAYNGSFYSPIMYILPPCSCSLAFAVLLSLPSANYFRDRLRAVDICSAVVRRDG